jgi:RNA polymerase sigma-70 factor (ECF subfamily)
MAGQMIRDVDLPDVVAAAGNGEHWALTELFRAYQPALLRYFRAQEPRVADDLAGEVWIAVAGSLAQFQGDEAGFRSWLFTIARRRLIDHRRRTARQRTDVVASERLDTVDEWGLGGDPATEVVDRIGAQGAVDALVAQLSPDQAEAVLLRVVGGLSVAETARIMSRPPGAVRVLCHRALRQLASRSDDGVVA